MPESKTRPYEFVYRPGPGLVQYDLTRDAAPFANITLLEFLNVLAKPHERKALRLKEFKWPDPPKPTGADDTVGIQRAVRYEFEVTENHGKFLMRYFPSVVLAALNNPNLKSKADQTKWAIESPRFDPNRLRISRDAGGIDKLPGVVRFPFADIVALDADGKKTVEKAMPAVLGIMHNLEEAVHTRRQERNLEKPGREGSVFASTLDQLEIYDVVIGRIFKRPTSAPDRPASEGADPKPGSPKEP